MEQSPTAADASTAVDPAREQARKRVQERREFGSHATAYVVFNALLIAIWALTGAGYFWPAWVAGCWGAGLALHAWETFGRQPVTEADIDAEVARQRSRSFRT